MAPYVIAWVCLTIGNFLYAAVAQPTWEHAIERSFFQAIAVLTVYFIARSWRTVA